MSKQVQQFVQSAVANAVPAGYSSSPVVERATGALTSILTEKAQQIADTLRARAQSEGLSESLVENALIEAGLADAPEPVTPETLEEKVDRLLSQSDEQGRTIAALLAAARRNGISVSV